MSVQSSVYSLLSEIVDPMLDALPEDTDLSLSPLLDLIDIEQVDSFDQPEAGRLDIWRTKSAPRIVVGDRWTYANGSRGMTKGQIRFKKITAQLEVGEDAYDRVRNGGPRRIIESQIRDQKKDVAQYLTERIESMAIRDLNNTDDGGARDNKFKGLFAASSTGTMSDPADMNATAGTAAALEAINFSGTNQSQNAIPSMLSGLYPYLVKKDGIVKSRKIPYRQIYMGLTSEFEAVLKSTKEILNSSTSQRSDDFQNEILLKAGIIPFVSEHFDYDYTFGTAETQTVTFFMDPNSDFKMMYVMPADGSTWSPDWEKVHQQDGDLKWATFQRNKKMEIGFLPRSYGIRDSDGAYTFYKKVFKMTLTPFENS